MSEIEELKYKVKIEQFEGPLDLLLSLIEKDELDITELSLSNVTEQYLEHLNQVEDLFPEELADFLVVATKLLLIKSKTLLPYLQQDEEDEGESLEDQLKIYKQYLDAMKKVEALIEQKNFIFPREQMKLSDLDVKFSPPEEIKAKDLKKTFTELLKSLEPIVRLPSAALTKVLSLKEKIAQVQELIVSKAQLSFHELLSEAEDRTEVIVTFLALLELIKQKVISVEQDDMFDDIAVKKLEEEN